MAKAPRHRLDEELARRGLFSSRDEAMRAIMAGDVSTTDRRLTSPGEQVREDTYLYVRGQKSYVGRGGLKLERALEAFAIDPTGMRCLDVGCSTGGFTDCLLKHGAASVVSVDVGYAQFDWGLREDPRVELHERTNIVDLPGPDNEGTIDLAVCDVSFTSVTVVLPAVMRMLADDGSFVTLVKPQFEAARDEVGEGGIVRDPAVRLAALEKVANAFSEAGLNLAACCPSPISGHKGNTEFLLMGTGKPMPAGELDLKAVALRGEVCTLFSA